MLASVLWLASCTGLAGPSPSPLPASPSATPAPPTPTPKPLAAVVNGEALPLAAFEAEVARFEAAQQALGIDPAAMGDYQAQVLQALIDRLLLAQGARQRGLAPDAADVDSRMETLAEQVGGNEAMGAWLAANGYNLEDFKAALELETLAAQMVSVLASEVPEQAEQVHARHILVASQEEAERLRAEILAGGDFAALAQAHSLDLSTRLAGGDLGWFPRGSLTTPEVEAVAFSLEPGQVSEVVKSEWGFHLVEVLERAGRPLSPQALRRAQEQAVVDWLAAQREQATIEVLIQMP